MIEVEIRGRLDKAGFDRLKQFMQKSGKHLESHEREMYLLFDYPGYDEDPTVREVDIRLRRTDEFCEIMVKRKAGEGNTARHELSLPLAVKDLDTAKKVLSALGCTKAIKMHRWKDVYQYHDIEWSIVKTPKDYFYYEAELTLAEGDDVTAAHQKLEQEAKALDLQVLNQEQMKEFIAFLDKEVNEAVDL